VYVPILFIALWHVLSMGSVHLDPNYMQTVNLAGLKVSRLCFGTEPLAIKKGPDDRMTQGDKTPVEGGEILAEASRLGVYMWDTSDDYGTHPHVREALKRVKRSSVVVSDKSNAATYEQGVKAVDFVLKDLGTEYIDIMFLHIVPPRPVQRKDANDRPYTSQDLKGRKGTLEAYMEARDSGLIKKIALSTHSTETLRQVLDYPDIDVVCAPLNKVGTYVDDGTQQERLDALKALHDAGKGVYVIKLLAAGRYKDNAEACIRYALGFRDFIDAWNIGMYDVADVKRNIALFSDALR
jgi:aryl-alcohol dehydrogenase-like predicted oxidoreductase